MPSPRRSLAWLLILLVAPRALADDPPGSPIPSDPIFQACRTDGTTATGRIAQMGQGGRLVLLDGSTEVAIPLAQLVKLTREGEAPAWPPEGGLILFPGGDRLRARVDGTTDAAVEVSPNLLDRLSVPLPPDGPLPLDAPSALILAPPADPSVAESLIARARSEPRKSEVLWLANGDTLAGGFLGLGPRKVSFQRDAGPSDVDRSGVVGIGFDPRLARYPEPKGAHLELTFLDGSRLGVTECRVEQGHIIATSRFGATIRPPLAELARVHVRGGSVAYLSERKEALAEYVGYIGPHRKAIGRDAALDGRALRLGGQPYDRGIQAQSRTLLAYRLTPGDRRFQATVGLDDRAGALGSVVFKVLVDGKERLASPAMTPRDAPRNLDVDLAGGRILILATEFGERGDVQDLADWVEARIIREIAPAR